MTDERMAIAALDTWRNRFAVRLCNMILNTVASREYCDTLGEVVLKGMKRNLRTEKEEPQ